MPKAYSIVDVEITDPDLFAEYVAGHPGTLEKFGGRFLVAGGEYEVIEGDWKPKTVVLHEWPDRAAFHAWYDSEAYRPWKEMRHKASKAKVILVDGV